MGGAAAYQAARRGLKVIGIDRFHPPHCRGSSHGQTRITREAIGEGEHYSPFVLRANQIWEDFEAELGIRLIERTGFLFITQDDAATAHHGRPGFLAATRRAATLHGIAHETLDAAALAQRFPQFLGLSGNEEAYYEPGGGYLHAERCVAAQIDMARRHGAAIQTDARVIELKPTANGVIVRTADRDIWAERVVLASGAWLSKLSRGSEHAALTITRQVLHWFPLADRRAWRPDASPTYIWTYGRTSSEQFYGFPSIEGQVKVAIEDESRLVDPDQLATGASLAERTCIVDHVSGRLAGVVSMPVRSEPCMYTSTPDQDFIIGPHRDSDHIRIVSACSGHGFKHAAAIGEAVVAELLGESGMDLRPFLPDRFARTPQ